MKKILLPALASLLVLSGARPVHAQDTIPADTMRTAVPYRTDAQPAAPCVREVRRIAPPPSPRSFRRQWPLAAAGSALGWLIADRIEGPRGNALVILSGSTLGAILGSHLQARAEGHPNLGRSIVGGVLGTVPAGALVYLNRADTYNEREFLTRGVVPLLGGALQGAVTATATSSSLQPARTLIVECPQSPTVG